MAATPSRDMRCVTVDIRLLCRRVRAPVDSPERALMVDQTCKRAGGWLDEQPRRLRKSSDMPDQARAKVPVDSPERALVH